MLRFIVATDKADEVHLSPDRRFWLPRDAAVDSATVLNHLSNCATTQDALTFEIEGVLIDDCVTDWFSDMLYCVENFRFECLILRLEYGYTAEVIAFLKFTRFPLRANTEVDGLRDVWLQVCYEALEALTEERFLEWPYMQALDHIHLEARNFCTVRN
ncbi:hypothetical protein AAVH_27277 [Aphelenchoides avenae]|nr:hypothetical protein AAVH_27277 [Aphelenchus avenae]